MNVLLTIAAEDCLKPVSIASTQHVSLHLTIVELAVIETDVGNDSSVGKESICISAL